MSIDELKAEMDTAEDKKMIRAKRKLFSYDPYNTNQDIRRMNLFVEKEAEE